MIELTRSEFNEFNLNSKLRLLEKDGDVVNHRIIDGRYKIQLYFVYGFYVQCIWDLFSIRIVNVEIIHSLNWLEFFDSS